MASTRIKICGITSQDDARAAIACGADAIGLVFYADSPRTVSVDQAAEIAAIVPPFVSVVALFVDEPAASIERILSSVPIDLIQFHGDEAPQILPAVRPSLDQGTAGQARLWISLRPAGSTDGARGILLDSWQEGVPGGTGKSFDWQLALGELSLPVVLAGGLHEGNVGNAIRTLRPAAVDVSGGVERSPGIKDAVQDTAIYCGCSGRRSTVGRIDK